MKSKGLFLIFSSTLLGVTIVTLLMWSIPGTPHVAKASISTTYTVCASDCDFDSIQTAIDSVNSGDTLNLAGEIFTESITIDKSLDLIGAGAESTIVQAAASPGIATSRVITVTSGVTVTIQDLSIRFGYSTRGGGIFNDQGGLTLKNTSVITNTASDSGGGICNNGELTVTNSIFSGNIANFGGGIYNSENELYLTDVIFQKNSGSVGGGVYHIYMNPQYTPKSILENVTFSGNIGGGMSTVQCSTEFYNVTFTNNSGGGLRNFGSNAMLEGAGFINNTISMGTDPGYGGGMHNVFSWVKITNGIFHNNSADYGGGLSIVGDNYEIRNVSFSDNSATYSGGGIYVNGGSTSVFNTILWGNTSTTSGSQIHLESGSFGIAHSIIQDSGGSGAGWDSSLGSDGGGNIDADPHFVDPGNSNLRLKANSRAIDTGTISVCPANDLSNSPRPLGLTCDMGAYEYWGIYLRKHVNQSMPLPGQAITYSVNAVNSMTGTISGGIISDTIPNGLTFLGPITIDPPLSGTVSIEPPVLVTDLEVVAGHQVTITFPVNVSTSLTAGTVITNTASILCTEVITPSQYLVSIMIPYLSYVPLIIR
jgi:uncharacterized repeat protein (TIGR01451 family)